MKKFTKEEFLMALKKEHFAQKIGDKDFDCGCPCGGGEVLIDGKKFGFSARCWRTSENAQDLYIWGGHPAEKELARAVKRNLDKQEWYNPYTIIYKKDA